MGKIIILNASPRAPKSNSKLYADIFIKNCKEKTEYYNISKNNHTELCGKINGFTDLLFVFPLYADGIPSTLLGFLKTLEKNPPEKKPTVSVIVNCGFFEPAQNDTAVDMVKLFCAQNGFPFGSSLQIGSGEAILDTPFRSFAERKIKMLAGCISDGKQRVLKTTMPLPKRIFIRASTSYWLEYGRKNGVTEEEMRTMSIEKF